MAKNKIYIGQYHGISLISRAIQFFTWSEISHTSAFVPRENEPIENWHVIEAWQYTGVIRRPWRDGHEPGTIIDVYSIDCTREQNRIFYYEMMKAIGTPYDYAGILGFIARGCLHSDKKVFCSELVFQSLLTAGIRLLERIESYQVSPGLINLSPKFNFHQRLVT